MKEDIARYVAQRRAEGFEKFGDAPTLLEQEAKAQTMEGCGEIWGDVEDVGA